MEYWTIIDDRHAGPFSAERLIEMGIKPDSPVWTPGLPDWVEAAEIESLKNLLASPSPTSPAPAASPAPTPLSQSASSQASTPVPATQTTPSPSPAPAAPTLQPQVPPQPMEPVGGFHSPNEERGINPPMPTPQAPVWEWQRENVLPPTVPCPPAYLAWSIIVTILCCQPIGIAAIICSAQTKQAYSRGNIQKATKMSDWAQWLIIAAIVLGLISLPIQLALL